METHLFFYCLWANNSTNRKICENPYNCNSNRNKLNKLSFDKMERRQESTECKNCKLHISQTNSFKYVTCKELLAW